MKNNNINQGIWKVDESDRNETRECFINDFNNLINKINKYWYNNKAPNQAANIAIEVIKIFYRKDKDLKNNLKIPKSFKIFGETFHIKYDKKQLDDHDAWGRTVFKTNELILMDNEFPEDKIQKIFWHEVSHIIFEKLNWNNKFFKDKEDEEHIAEMLGSILNQIINTMEY